MDTKLMSKYSRKDQNHKENLKLKNDILDFLSGKLEKVIREYKDLNTVGYYRRVAINFLEDLEMYYGICVRTTGKKLIIEREN